MKYILIPLLLILVLSEVLGLLSKYPAVVFIYGVINGIVWVEGTFYIIFNVMIEKNAFAVRAKRLFKIFLLWILMYVVGICVMIFYDVGFNKFEWVSLVLLSSWLWNDIKKILNKKSETED